MTAKLTVPERAAIDAVRFLAVKGGWVRAREVAARTGQSEQGAGLVLGGGCLRKGLVKRCTGRGHVWFALTGHGWDLARPRGQERTRLPLACGHKSGLLLAAAAHRARREGVVWCPACETRQYVAADQATA